MLDSSYYTEYLRRQGVRIGKNSVVLYPSYVDGRLPYLVEIGDDVIISLHTTILTHDATSAYAGDLIKVGRVTIHDHSFIGANSVVLCNVSIGPDAIIGAGSVVTGDVPPNTVYAGNPAKFVCSLESFIDKHLKAAETRPIREGGNFPHPYISKEGQEGLKADLRQGFGYFCAKLPAGRKVAEEESERLVGNV